MAAPFFFHKTSTPPAHELSILFPQMFAFLPSRAFSVCQSSAQVSLSRSCLLSASPSILRLPSPLLPASCFFPLWPLSHLLKSAPRPCPRELVTSSLHLFCFSFHQLPFTPPTSLLPLTLGVGA